MFLIHSRDVASTLSTEFMPCTAAVKIGTALKFSAGKLVLASGTSKPEYIAMTNRDADSAGGAIPCVRVDAQTVFETELEDATNTIVLGSKYTISADGGMITSTATSGVAEIVGFDGTAAGSKVRVRF